MPKKLTLKSFIERANNKHNFKYNYSLVDFKIGTDKITIVCPIHGEFEQIAKTHLKSGCKKCSNDNFRTKPEKFIEKALKIHKNKYDYSLIKYIPKNDVKLEIICKIHGIFYQSMNSHLTGRECPFCGRIKSDKSRTKNTEKWIKLAKSIHGDRYDYGKVNYKGCYEYVEIGCSKHGFFLQKAYNHLNYKGCKKCAKIKPIKYFNRYKEQFLQKAPLIHNNFYDYSKINYINAHTKMTIICPEHGEFYLNANSHLDGVGCKECYYEKDGFGKVSFIKACKKGYAIFYILKCKNENEEFIKIGITNKSIKERYPSKNSMPYNYEIIQEYSDTPDKIWDLERFIIKNYKQSKYKPIKQFHGKTECFLLDIKEKLIYDISTNEGFT